MSVNLDGTDAEVNTAYIQARSGLGIPSVINTAMIQPVSLPVASFWVPQLQLSLQHFGIS